MVNTLNGGSAFTLEEHNLDASWKKEFHKTGSTVSISIIQYKRSEGLEVQNLAVQVCKSCMAMVLFLLINQIWLSTGT